METSDSVYDSVCHYIYIWKLDKSIRHNFSVTLSFTLAQSSDRFNQTDLIRSSASLHKPETQSHRKVMSYWFVQLSDIPHSANTSSTIPQG